MREKLGPLIRADWLLMVFRINHLNKLVSKGRRESGNEVAVRTMREFKNSCQLSETKIWQFLMMLAAKHNPKTLKLPQSSILK